MTDDFPPPLPPERLFRPCRLEGQDFETTAELEASETIIGQERAVEAIHFAARMDQPGYNLFVIGPAGLGKHTTVQSLLQAKAAGEPAPQDWVYVHDFDAPYRPKALALPPGGGRRLQEAIARLIEEVRRAVPAAFENQDYQNRREALESSFRKRQEQSLEELRRKTAAQNLTVVRTPSGLALAPLREGEVLSPEAFQQLPKEEQERIRAASAALEPELEAVVRLLPKLEQERREKLQALNEEVTAFAVGLPIDELQYRFAALPEVCRHLKAVRDDLVEHVHALFQAERGEDSRPLAGAPGFRRYEVNLLVGHERKGAAPVVYEDNPTLPNLLGRVEHLARMGALTTDFTLIKAGALHRANGGYLVLDVRALLAQPLAWDALKRALRGGRIVIESLASLTSPISTVTLEPQPIPLQVKVVLSGDRLLHHLLQSHDPDVPEMFKVAADFDEELERDAEGEAAFARLIAGMAAREGLRPFTRSAVARVIEQAARLADDAERLSLHLRRIADLLREADFLAREAGLERVEAAQVEAALAGQRRRGDRLRLRSLEAMERALLHIATEGESVGEVNGLTVLSLGEIAFGRPTRITARVRVGTGRVVDIEREVAMGGPIHSKGVMILAGYLGAAFAPELPLSLAATLVFEQSYSGVEGDSASCAELCALLSALAEAPLRQSLAITGSLDQQGRVQAIGGVNDKIEGFFDLCAARGLTGEQGVIVPAANLQHLMLRAEVVEACRAGRFAVHAVERVAQAAALLTGLPAGRRDAEGHYPEGSLFGRVEARLRALAEARRRFLGTGPAEEV